MSQENPLNIIADPRFQKIITRAMKRARVAPLSSKEKSRSERSSWSSPSRVSSIDLKSPEPELQNKLTQKLQTIKQKSRKQKLLFGLSIFLLLLTLIIIILSIILPFILIKNPSTNNGTNSSSVINEN